MGTVVDLVSQAGLRAALPDAELVLAVRRGDTGAKHALFDRHATYVARVLTRCLGTTPEISDLVHDVFVLAFRDIEKLRAAEALKGWLGAIAVHVARGSLRSKRRRRWLSFFAPEDIPEVPAPVSDHETRAAIRATYAILDTLPDDQRVAFALRYIDQMELTEVAAACKTSLATIKRRLVRAHAAFVAAARDHEELRPWLDAAEKDTP